MAKDAMSIRVYVEPELKNRFKTACFLQGLNMSDVTAKLIKEWVAENAVNIPVVKKATAATKVPTPAKAPAKAKPATK